MTEQADDKSPQHTSKSASVYDAPKNLEDVAVQPSVAGKLSSDQSKKNKKAANGSGKPSSGNGKSSGTIPKKLAKNASKQSGKEAKPSSIPTSRSSLSNEKCMIPIKII